MIGGDDMEYCGRKNSCPENVKYHDGEWGVPLHDDRKQFEFLMLEAMQCGLNRNMIIKKREIFRACFDDFDYEKTARYDEADIERILQYDGMRHSRRKTEAVINNARCFIKIREEFDSFDSFIWSFSGGRTILYENHGKGYIPAENGLSDRISRELKKRGFKYLGGVTVYSHLQACGIICDHDENCPCYKRITESFPTVRMSCSDEKNVRFFGAEVSEEKP